MLGDGINVEKGYGRLDLANGRQAELNTQYAVRDSRSLCARLLYVRGSLTRSFLLANILTNRMPFPAADFGWLRFRFQDLDDLIRGHASFQHLLFESGIQLRLAAPAPVVRECAENNSREGNHESENNGDKPRFSIQNPA
jgi:hypothetical protein